MIRIYFLRVLLASVVCLGVCEGQQNQSTSPRTSPKIHVLLSHHHFYALLIAINRYQDRSLPSLRTPINDAQALKKVLQEDFGFSVKLLTDATRDEILASLNTYRSNLPDDSSLLIFFAGHSLYDHETNSAYWIPSDGNTASRAHWILTDEVTSETRALRARHVLIVADSCYSGALTITRGIGHTTSDIDIQDHLKFLSKMFESRSRTLMASGGNEPVLDSADSGGHSLFMGAVLAAFRLMDSDVFTARELFEPIKIRVSGISEQIPQYSTLRNSGDEFGDFVFARTTPSNGNVFVGAEPTESPTLTGTPADPTDPAVYVSRGINLQLQGRFDEAIKEYEVALRLKPDYADAHYHLALLYTRCPDAQRRNPELALKEAQQAFGATDSPASDQAGLLADALYMNGRTDEALAVARKALALDPKNPDLISQIARYEERPYSAPAAQSIESARGVRVQPATTKVAEIVGNSNYYALVIGINEYRDWPKDRKLTTAEHDAEAVADLLVTKYTFEKDNVKRLLGPRATRENVITALDSYARLPEDANLLIYFAGHGDENNTTKEAYWLPADSSPASHANWINSYDVTLALKATPARHVLVVADSCYAGGMPRLADALMPKAAEEPQGRLQRLKREAVSASRTLLSSGGDFPVDDGGGHDGHSVFASAFLDSLEEMEVPLFDAAELVHFKVDYKVSSRSPHQQPRYVPIQGSMPHEMRADQGDFIFVRRARQK